MSLIAGDKSVAYDLVHGTEIVELNGDSWLTVGSYIGGEIFRYWVFDRLRGFGCGGAHLSTNEVSYPFGNNGPQNMNSVTVTMANAYNGGTDPVPTDGLSFYNRMDLNFSAGTVGAGDSLAYNNNVTRNTVGYPPNNTSLQGFWWRAGNWLNVAGTSATFEWLNYETAASPDGKLFLCPYLPGPWTQLGTGSPFARNTGFNLRSTNFTTAAFDSGYRALRCAVRATAGQNFAGTETVKSLGFRVRRDGAGIVFHNAAIGGTQLNDWVNTTTCSQANFTAQHNLLGTGIFVMQAGGNDVTQAYAAGAYNYYRTKIDTYIDMVKAYNSSARVILLSPPPVKTANEQTALSAAATAYSDAAAARGAKGGVLALDLGSVTLPYASNYAGRVDVWATSTYYQAGMFVTHSGTKYAVRADHTSSTNPTVDTTNYTPSIGGSYLHNVSMVSHSNPGWGADSHPNPRGAIAWACQTWGLVTAADQAYQGGRRSIFAGRIMS